MPMRGYKWMMEATYLTEDDRTKIMLKVEECRNFLRHTTGPRFESHNLETGEIRMKYKVSSVGVRAPTYIGEPNPIAAITYGPGGCVLYGFVYR